MYWISFTTLSFFSFPDGSLFLKPEVEIAPNSSLVCNQFKLVCFLCFTPQNVLNAVLKIRIYYLLCCMLSFFPDLIILICTYLFLSWIQQTQEQNNISKDFLSKWFSTNQSNNQYLHLHGIDQVTIQAWTVLKNVTTWNSLQNCKALIPVLVNASFLRLNCNKIGPTVSGLLFSYRSGKKVVDLNIIKCGQVND